MSADCFEWRKSVYLLLCRSFFDATMHPLSSILATAPESAGMLKPYMRALISASYSEKREELRSEYTHIFESGSGIPQWESSSAEGRNILLDETTLAVRTLMQESGIDIDSSTGQPADFIGNELAFMFWLASGEQSSETVAGQLSFLQAHLGPFANTLVAWVQRSTENSVIVAYSDFLISFLRWDTGFLERCAGESYGVFHSAGESGRECPPGMIVFSGDKSGIDEAIVMTAGRGNCGGRCIIRSHVRNGCILRLSTDESDGSDGLPVLKACPRGHGYRKTFLSPNRLMYPLKRCGERGEGRFIRISWDEAVKTVSDETQRVREQYGAGARYVNYASGINAVLRGDKLAKRLLALDGGYLDWYNTYSAACAEYATPFTYGTSDTGSSYSTLDKSEYIILWGENPIETYFGGEYLSALKAAKKRGVPIVVIDPRYSDTAAAFATEWVPIRPTTDSALADGMAYVILREGLQDQHFMDTYCLGFDEKHMPLGAEPGGSYLDYVFGVSDGVPKTPEWAEAITGVPRDTIVRLARAYATEKPAALIPGLGLQRHANGEQSVRSTTLLPCLTGNVGIEGGHAGGCNLLKTRAEPSLPTTPNPYPASIPSFLWTDAVSRGGSLSRRDGIVGADSLESPIKLIYNLAGNTLVNQHSDCGRTAEILRDSTKCEFIVCSDVFMTSSAKFADILLPATSMFESCNINKPWGQGNFLLYSSPAISPLWECRFEYDWLGEVADRLGVGNEFRGGHETSRDWLAELYSRTRELEQELPPFEELECQGVYKYSSIPSITAFKSQIENPEEHPFLTPSGKIEIYSSALKKRGEIPPIPCYTPCFEGPEDEAAAEYPLQLIGWHIKTHTHSVHDNNEWMDDIEGHSVWIHPDDAEGRIIKDGDMVCVYNSRGRINVRAHVTERIMPGVVALPQGSWYTPDKNGLDRHGNINTLTTHRPTPLARGNPQHSNLVEIRVAEVAE